MVTDLLKELANFNQDFNPPNVEEAAAYYHERCTLYTAATGKFFAGRDDIENNYFAPLFASVRSASVDFTPFHFSVISPATIIYGALEKQGGRCAIRIPAKHSLERDIPVD